MNHPAALALSQVSPHPVPPNSGTRIFVEGQAAAKLTDAQRIAELEGLVNAQQHLIMEQQAEIKTKGNDLKKERRERRLLGAELELRKGVGAQVEKILSELNSIEVTDPIAFFEYLLYELPKILDCDIKYHIPAIALDPETRVQNCKKSEIFVALLENSYSQIQSMRSPEKFAESDGILSRDAARGNFFWEAFPIVVENDSVGFIEFIRKDKARERLPDLLPHFKRIMRLINSHIDKVKLVTLIEENARIMSENLSLLYTDALTEVNSRRGFFAKTENLLSSYPHAASCMITIDIDFFKTINDRYGHSGGDAALKGVAKALQSELNLFLAGREAVGEIGRLWGEEFAIQLSGIGYEEAALFGEKLRMRVKEEFQSFSNGRSDLATTSITTSIGIAEFKERGESEDYAVWQARILDNADAALYYAKHSGRDQVVVFEQVSPQMLEQRKLEAAAHVPHRQAERVAAEAQTAASSPLSPIADPITYPL